MTPDATALSGRIGRAAELLLIFQDLGSCPVREIRSPNTIDCNAVGTVLCVVPFFSALRRYPNEEAPMSRIKNLREEALALHKDNVGEIDIRIKVPARDNDDLTLAYSPGVAEPCKEINKDPAMLDVYTNHSNFIIA